MLVALRKLKHRWKRQLLLKLLLKLQHLLKKPLRPNRLHLLKRLLRLLKKLPLLLKKQLLLSNLFYKSFNEKETEVPLSLFFVLLVMISGLIFISTLHNRLFLQFYTTSQCRGS